jgi:hypothetical protein
MKAVARPYFSDLEIAFLLDLFRHEEARIKRQVLNLEEEQQQTQWNVQALRQRLYVDPYSVHKDLKDEQARLNALRCEWLPTSSKQAVVLRGLAVRMEKILAHKRGPVEGMPMLFNRYLNELSLSL